MLNTWEIKQTAPLILEKQIFKNKNSSTSIYCNVHINYSVFWCSCFLLILLVVFCSKLFLIHCITDITGSWVTLVVITPRLFPHLHPPHPGDHLLPAPGLRPPDHPDPRPGELVPRHSEGHAGVRDDAPRVGSGVVTVPERDLNNTGLNSQQNLMSTVAKELLISLISLVQLFYRL